MDLEQYKRVPADDIPHAYRLGYSGNQFYAKITEYVTIKDDDDVTAWALIRLERDVVTELDHYIGKQFAIPDGSIVAAKTKKGVLYFVQPNNVSSRYVSNNNFW